MRAFLHGFYRDLVTAVPAIDTDFCRPDWRGPRRRLLWTSATARRAFGTDGAMNPDGVVACLSATEKVGRASAATRSAGDDNRFSRASWLSILRERVIDGTYAPGDRIREAALRQDSVLERTDPRGIAAGRGRARAARPGNVA